MSGERIKYEDDRDTLSELSDMFDDLSVDGPTPDQLYQMYGVFLNDMEKNPIRIKGKNLTFNKSISKHPVCKGKYVGFEHIITRESKYKGKRIFDRERANKIHWIKPIIENVHDVRIKYFERINENGFNQQFYWYESKSFLVIVREVNPEMFLITSFSVDKIERNKYKEWYEEYKNKKTPLRK